ncbi:MAG: flagellar hook-associated protein FlgK [Pseudomonadota bacterium]
MSGSSFLDIGVSGLQVAQQQLNTTSHNIANVNTVGYSRQVTISTTQIPQATGGYFIGTGAIVDSTQRIYDYTLVDSHRDNISNFYQQETFAQRSGYIDNLLLDPESGITATLTRFFDSLNEVSLYPSLDGPRQTALASAEALAAQFNQIYSELSKEADLVDQSLENITLQITALAQSIAELNDAIVTAVGSSEGATPNDLLDLRDAAIDELSQYVSTSYVEDADGSYNVYIGNGQPLVIGNVSTSLTTQVSASDPLQTEIVLQTSAASIPITDTLSGGQIQGLLDYRNEVLLSAFNQLGKMAIAISETMNAQHELGMDLNDDLGGLFFTDPNSPEYVAERVIENANNTGTVDLGATITDIAQLIDSDYRLSYDGTNYTIFRESDSQTFGPFTTLPITLDGFTLDIANAGTLVAGDEFKIIPTRSGASDIGVVINDIDELAAAFPVQGEESLNNIGTGNIAAITMLDTTTAAFTTTANTLTPPISVVITEPTPGNYEYSIFDITVPGTPVLVDGPRTYIPESDNNLLAPGGLDALYGYEITLNGSPLAGDTFEFGYNNGGTGDNRNSLELNGLETAKVLDGNSSSYSETYARLVSDLGSKTNEAMIAGEVAEGLLTQSSNAQLSISGVNLDEEAANLIRYQQAYQASAQIIAVAGVIFDTLIQSVR